MKDFIYKLLRKSEKYTKTDMIYLTKGSLWLSLGYGTNIIKGLAVSILMANMLPKEDYGYYKFILSIFGLVSVFALSGMGTAITQSVARNIDGIFKKAIKIILKWSWIGSLVLLGIAAYYFNKDNFNFTWIFIFLAFLFPWHSISSYYATILSGKKRFDIQTKYFTIYSLITALAIIISILITKNIFWIIFTFILSGTLIGCFFTYKAYKKFLINDKIDNESIKYGFRLSFINVIAIVAQNIDKIILPILLGYQELAIYALALLVPEQIKAWFKNFGILSLPKFSEQQESKEIKQKIISLSFKATIIIALIIIIYWLTADWVFGLIYPKYPEAVIYSKFLSLSLLSIPFAILGDTFLRAHKNSKKLLKVNIIFYITKILLILILTSYYGIWGIVAAIIISRFVQAITIMFQVRKES